MPPASLPALAAIRPGPSSPRRTTTRLRRERSRAGRCGRAEATERARRMAAGTRPRIHLIAPLDAHAGDPRPVRLKAASILAEETEPAAPALRQQHLEHVVDGDYADHPFPLVDDRRR